MSLWSSVLVFGAAIWEDDGRVRKAAKVILITAACGNQGKWLVPRLVKAGHRCARVRKDRSLWRMVARTGCGGGAGRRPCR